MASRKWVTFKDPDARFERAGPALRKAWPRLHRGDCEPWPAGNAALQDAWRDFHAGRFAAAVAAGEALGPEGAAVATKAAGVYATYLARDADEATAALRAAVERLRVRVHGLSDLPRIHHDDYTLQT